MYYLLHESECDISRAGEFIFTESEGVKIKPESEIKPKSEISRHNTLTTSVISGLFHTRYLHYCS